MAAGSGPAGTEIHFKRAELEAMLAEKVGGGRNFFWHVWPDGNLESVTVRL